MARATARYRIEADVSSAAESLRKIQSGFDSTADAARKMGGTLLAAAGVGGVGALITRTVQLNAEIGRTAERLGVSTEFLSEFRGALNELGGDYDGFREGTIALAERLVELAEGSESVEAAFGRLGLTFEDFQGLNLEQSALAFVDALRATESGLLRTATAQEILSDDAREFLRLAGLTDEELEALLQTQRDIGNSLSQDVADNAIKAAEAIARIENALQGLATSATITGIERVFRLIEQGSDVLGLFRAEGGPEAALARIAQPSVQLGPALRPDQLGRVGENLQEAQISQEPLERGIGLNNRLAEQLFESNLRQEELAREIRDRQNLAVFQG